MTVAGHRLDLDGPRPARAVRHDPWRKHVDRGMDMHELMLGTSFHFANAPHPDFGGFTAWGRGISGGSDTRSANGLSLRSESATGVFGMDWEHDGLMTGMALTQTVGEATASLAGTDYGIEGSLTMAAPYVHFRASDRLSFWGVVGTGGGRMGGAAWRDPADGRHLDAARRSRRARGAAAGASE